MTTALDDTASVGGARRLAPGKPAEFGEGITLAVLVLFVTLICGLPMALLFKVGLTGPAGIDLAPLAEAMANRSVQTALWNSLESSVLSALLAVILGALLALAVGLTDVRAKGPLVFCLLLPMMIPPHVIAIAWIQAMGPGSPLLKPLGLAPEMGETPGIYSVTGLVSLLALQHAPLVFLILRAALRALPRELADAARVCGAGGPRVLLRITLPLIAPSLLASFMLAFVAALGNFGINALLGIPARYTTLPVLMWRRLASFGPDVLPNVAVISVVLAVVTLLAVGLQSLLQRRLRASLIGLPQAPLAYALGRARLPLEMALWGFIAVTLALPFAALVATALVPTYGLALTPATLTLDNFAEVLWRQGVTLRAFANSTLTAAAAAALIAAVAIGLGHLMVHRTGRTRQLAGLASAQADIAFAVPGLVVSIAFILAFLKPLPGLGLSLYGTLWIILLAYVAVFLSVGLKPVTAAYLQMDRSLEDAARVAGAGYLKRVRRIFAPLVAPAAASGAILVFLTAYNEVTVSALLWSSGTETIGTTIFNYEDSGATTLAAAMSTVVVLATVAVMVAMNGLARHVPAGSIPWRD
ncbi:ABC transporter permease subunit [Microvirga tunisiensis]|uniref:ABC transporter permease subunit n=1 Tax=Pannonibacter tanglangensis TaxID=2750084 RepID=A0A7X5J9H3_9HYPH|nr:iron ABC transporter permease [Pannonibacter sp. XCT-53]NBN79829.1 ABC transporter permease subunit [Pannonibacter sp. XCT-53]